METLVEVKPIHSPAEKEEHWDLVLEPKHKLLDLKLEGLWRYRDLLFMLVKRDFIAQYKQTIMGPLWFIIQPLLTTLTFTIIFGKVAGLSTEGQPMILFYMAGITLWNYFSECLNKTASVFRDNASLFGKVYFPRMIMPLSIVISNLIRLSIQLLLFFLFWLYFLQTTGTVHPNVVALYLPILILFMGLLGLGFGMIISSLTTKYRDLIFLVTFGVQLLMYSTPVIYPLSSVDATYKWLILLNPMTSIIETFRFGFLGTGSYQPVYLLYSALFSVIVVFSGMIIFNRSEKKFLDTV